MTGQVSVMYRLTLPIRIEALDDATYRKLILDFGELCSEQWCLALVLLQEGLAASLLVSDGSGRPRLSVSTNDAISRNQRARINWERDVPALELGRVELEAWLHFFLKYYRDGVAEVDHIDLEIQTEKQGQKPTDVVLRVARSCFPSV
jgi:hypothetical protein